MVNTVRKITKERNIKMVVNDWIHVIAGIFILVSVALGVWVHPYWFFFTAFVGANLFQYGLSKFCPMGLILKILGVPENR
jgi:fatty acid desaturase